MFRHRSTAAAIGTAAGIGALGIATVLITAPAIAATGEGSAGSYAEGRFLGGTILDADLATLVALDSATAVNDGSSAVSEERNPFSATALEDTTFAPGTVEVSDADGVDAGAVGQVAIARNDGSSYAYAGALGSDGAVGVSPSSGAEASIDLATLLGDALPDALAGLRLEAAGVAAEAEAELGDVRGDYTLADARLVLDVPAVASSQERTETAVAPIETSLAELGAPSGPLAGVVDDALASLGLGGLGGVDVTVDAGLDDIVASVGDTVLRDDALTIDLDSGTIAVDLAALPDGAGLEDLEPGTELLSDAVVGDIVDGVERLLRGYFGELEVRIADAVRDAQVDVTAHVSVLDEVPAGETVRTVTTPVTQVIDAVSGEVLGILDPGTGAVTSLVPGVSGDVLAQLLLGVDPTDVGLLGLGGLVGDGGLPAVTTRVVAEASTVTEPAFSTLETSADVDISGTLAGIRGGQVAGASADATVLGAPVALDASIIVDGLSDALGAALPGGAPTGVSDAIDAGVLDPVLGAITGDEPSGGASDGDGGASDGDGSGGIGDLAGLVSLQANVQSTADDGAFTQTALRVELLGGDLATVDLANATVGPNAVPGGTGGGEGTPPFAAAGSGELAFTGFAIGLIALLGAVFVGLGAYALWRSRALAAAAEKEIIG